MKVIIAGSRDFEDYDHLREKVNEFRKNNVITEIVSGNARGADRLGEKYSTEYGLNLTLYPANWKKYGNAAGPIRNRAMAEYADALIAVWDGNSKGTENMIDCMHKLKKPVYVILYDAETAKGLT